MLLSVATPKTRMVNVRLTEKVHEDFKIACELRGGSMSSLLYQFIVRTIREEREMEPKAFERITTSRLNGTTLANNSPHSLKTPKTQDRRKKQAG
jgi:hypothetical protein